MKIETKFDIGDWVRYYIGNQFFGFQISEIRIVGEGNPCYMSGLPMEYSSLEMSNMLDEWKIKGYFFEETNLELVRRGIDSKYPINPLVMKYNELCANGDSF